MRIRNVFLLVVFGAVTAGLAAAGTAQGPDAGGKLILYGDIVYFQGRGLPDNCVGKTRYRRGENVGFRMAAVDAEGSIVESAELVVHVTTGGKTTDLPMRLRPNQSGSPFWVAKWVVPPDTPVGIVRYTVTAKDKNGRTGEFRPFAVEGSQLTIVE